MLIIAVIFISSALLLYSISIWSEKIGRGLKSWMVNIFTCAFSCDLFGTSLMFFLAADRFQFSAHTICGYFALLVMGLHLFWARVALRRHGRAEKYFHRFSIVAWVIWLFAFTSGIPNA
jgi:uncharacterized repeat protein (TIGR03987 family)